MAFIFSRRVEKALKAALAERMIEIPRTHDLGYLVELLEDLGIEGPEPVVSSDWLTPWGVLFRYDDNADDLDRNRALEAATAAISLAEQIVAEND